MKKYPLAKPNLDKEEERAVITVLRSGILSIGPKVSEFERRFAKKIGTKYACAVSSGTAGLHLALLASGIGKGDEVITTPFSFAASAASILYVGGRPVFVDIDPLYYNIDPEKIEARLTKKTKAILVVHIFGQPADMSAILPIAKKHKLTIIEDACESILARHQGKPVGAFGQSAVFAFYPNKQMTTGEGGMVATNNKRVDELCRSLRNQGRAPNMQWLEHKRLGYNYRLDEMSAAVGCAQLGKLDQAIARRKKIAGWYNKHLTPYKNLIQTPLVAAGNTHTWFVYVIKFLSPKINRDAVIRRLARLGVAAKPYLPSIHLFDFYKKTFHYQKGDFPVSENTSQKTLALPFYQDLQESDICVIVKRLLTTIKHYGNGK